eukprot:CAMPEP_0119280290 /NCGR_PEP_ID=MMETSP1329-20130426/22353_1 /TAXON_ID=114041 /ORGANISM="Genus nov. species nov., Strain RCC1024" /LENGTH=292 /DNA_ID=CAMNT_0007280873 /DNA_START=254 /DNA_END=1129 /DNA_ORIENTATION=+
MRRIALLAALCLRATALKKVLVTGAGGRTGKLVFSQLQQDPEFKAVGLARSPKAVKALEKAGAAAEEIVQADTLDEAALAEAMAGCEGVVLCTSATPQIKKLSLLKALATKAIPFLKPARPAFRFPANGTPEEVDWIGAKKQIDAAKAAGVAHFVLVSSMGGTQPDNFLNSIGRRADGSGGDILLWKRKAERYLIESGLTYTVVHPGGLVDEPGGARELTVGIDDELLGQKSRSVARADVARVCVAALFNEKAENLAFDLASKPAGEGTATADAAAVFDQLTPGAYSYATVL